MRRIFITIAYDGTDYCGWQIQDNGITVQQEVEKALSRIHKEKTRIFGSGRTDSGVHARGQVAHFDSPMDSIPIHKYPLAINAILPRDIRVTGCREESVDLHARFNARVRIYHYYLRPGFVSLPEENRFSWGLYHQPNLVELNKMAAVVAGTHDFTAFAAQGDPNPSKVRRVFTSAFYPQGNFIVYRIAGTAFLWHMVRSLVGTMVYLEKAGGNGEGMAAILESRERCRAGTTAPAGGLFLEKVLYDENAPY
ncbi:MAG: tRNA pseudouridine(38-40) synthase TruA [Spirochaetales bacterium]|nr:tRNA pseudouridine(38-40) synthase TruA [Spirochaetales bacterium]